MNKKLLIIGIAILLIATVTATALFMFPFNPKQPPTADDIGSTEHGMNTVIDANNQFAFDLYSELSKSEKGNLFYSPYSISAALAMTYEGASGKTADEMKSVFHFPESNVLRTNFAAIYNDINKGSKDYELKTGNALWVQNNFKLLPDYTSNVEKYYGGKAANLDFITQTEQSRLTINSFIEQQTNGKIKELLEKGMLNSMTRLVLTNAIYFKGTWEWEFDKSDTNEQDFKVTPSNTVKAQMMYMKPDKAKFNYYEDEKLQILELPYKGNISMLVLLPADNLNSIALTAEKLSLYKAKMKQTKLDAIYLPKFEFDTKYGMNENLKALGMPTAFDASSADFSGMTGKKDLFIGFVVHQAYVKVDEKGTEAAAATAVGMELTSAGPRDQIIFRADHPFIFMIQDKGNILFMGRMNDPTQ
jgi:serine protease inhibitor